jgi:hypothetical protein
MLAIEFEGNNLVIQKNERKNVLDLKIASAKLLESSQGERELYLISPSGYGIHWLLVDEGLLVKGLNLKGNDPK